MLLPFHILSISQASFALMLFNSAVDGTSEVGRVDVDGRRSGTAVRTSGSAFREVDFDEGREISKFCLLVLFELRAVSPWLEPLVGTLDELDDGVG